MQEKELIALLKSRNEKGIEELLLHYGPLMRYIITPILPNPQDREDCLSEVVMRIWEKIDTFDEKRGNWNSWVTALTRNTALNKARDDKKHSFNTEIGEEIPSNILGRILYNKGEDVYVAAYESLNRETYTSTNFLFGEQSNIEIFATFSLPEDGERQRGYLSYAVKEVEDGWIINAWINYTHQQHGVQYPVETAKENRMTDSWNTTGTFKLIQDSIQFNPNE